VENFSVVEKFSYNNAFQRGGDIYPPPVEMIRYPPLIEAGDILSLVITIFDRPARFCQARYRVIVSSCRRGIGSGIARPSGSGAMGAPYVHADIGSGIWDRAVFMKIYGDRSPGYSV
jgi:hypothetical protein